MAAENKPFGGGPFGDGPFGPAPGDGGGATQNLAPSLYTNSNTFFTHAISVGAVNLSPSLYSDADTFFTHAISATITLSPSLYTDADTFFTHAISVGAVNLSPSLYSDADTFFTHAISVGAVNLSPSLFTDADTFFTHTLTNGGIVLEPSLYSDADTFFTHAISVGAVNLSPSLYTDADTFFTHAITQGGAQQDLTADLFENANTFYQHTVEVAAVEVPVEVVSGGGGYVRSRKTSFPKHRSDPWAVHRQRLQYILDEEEYDEDTQALIVKLTRAAYMKTAEYPKSPTNLAALRVLDALSREDAAGIPVPARLKAVRAEQRVLVRRLVKAYEFVQADEANVALLLKGAGFTVVQ
jgi:hypothetical protein